MASLGDDLLGTVNKLQDLVFNTIGNDSLDLPQIVSSPLSDHEKPNIRRSHRHEALADVCILIGRSWLPVIRQILGPREYRRSRLSTTRQRHRYSKTSHPTAHQFTK